MALSDSRQGLARAWSPRKSNFQPLNGAKGTQGRQHGSLCCPLTTRFRSHHSCGCPLIASGSSIPGGPAAVTLLGLWGLGWGWGRGSPSQGCGGGHGQGSPSSLLTSLDHERHWLMPWSPGHCRSPLLPALHLLDPPPSEAETRSSGFITSTTFFSSLSGTRKLFPFWERSAYLEGVQL